MTRKKNKYNEDAIKVYEGLAAVRKRPNMYMGRSGTPMIMQMLREIVENSCDEYDEGHNNYIAVKMTGKKEQTFTLADGGRGIPVKKHKKTKQSTLTTVMTKLHAGGKFDDESYKTSRGVHGVGVSATNALSSRLQVWTHREDNWYTQSFEKGVENSVVKKAKFPSSARGLGKKAGGTIIQFTPDYGIIGKAIVKEKDLVDWLSTVAKLNKGLKIKLVTDKNEYTFHNPKGPSFFLAELISEAKVETIGKPFVFESENLIVAIQWTDYSGEDGIHSFVNGANTSDGGTHVKGLNTTLTKAFKKVGKDRDKFTASDVRFGVVGFINYKLHNAEYDSQTKNELVTVSAVKEVEDILTKGFAKWMKENDRTVRKIIKRANEIKKAKEEAKKLIKATSSIKKKKRDILPSKLLQCSKKTPPEERELFILEGESAGGTASNARDYKTQTILPLRGKLINAAKAKLEKTLGSEEVKNIIMALGANPADLLSKKKDVSFDYGKVIILNDSDDDGWHIALLILTLFQELMPQLIAQNKVFLVDAPLFVASHKDKKYYGYDLDDIKSKLPKKFKGQIIRMKGWGEADAIDLEEIAFNPETRKLIQVTPVKGKKLTYFNQLVGESSAARKELLGV